MEVKIQTYDFDNQWDPDLDFVSFLLTIQSDPNTQDKIYIIDCVKGQHVLAHMRLFKFCNRKVQTYDFDNQWDPDALERLTILHFDSVLSNLWTKSFLLIA